MKSDSKSKSVMIIVGDVSADRHASFLVKALKETLTDLSIWGVGGDCLQEAGVELVYHLKNVNALGIVEVIKFIPLLAKIEKDLLQEFEQRKPDLVLLVDYGGFNLRISKKLRALYPNLPIVYFIAPQIWASRPWRISSIKEVTSKMLVIFPFEENLYRENNIQTRFVGHPLCEQIPKASMLPSRENFLSQLGVEAETKVISIFPGSRKQEIREHTPVLIQSMEKLLKRRPELRFLISMASDDLKEIFKTALAKADLGKRLGKEIILIEPESNYAAMAISDLVWAKSGTTTLEVAMFAKPMLIFYRGNWLSYFLVLLFKTIKNVGLPNLLAGKKLVPELLQLDCSARQFVRYTCDLLDVPGLQKEISQELSSIRDRLGKGNYITICAEEILKYLEVKPSSSA